MNKHKFWKSMKIFFVENRIISVLLLCSLTIMILYLREINSIDNSRKLSEWFILLNQLAIGYTINFMFYITQVYFPSQKKNALVNACIRNMIMKIENNMKRPFVQLSVLYLSYNKDNLSDDEIHQITISLKLSDQIDIFDINKNRKFTTKEWILKYLLETNNCIERLYQHYAAYIPPELMQILENIQNSSYHCDMKFYCASNINISFSQTPQEADFLVEYYHFFHKLTTYRNENF